MEITVADVEGLPAHTFLSVRCGDTRKQVPFRTGEVLNFPDNELPKAYTVDVLRKVGSAQVSVAGIDAMGGTIRHDKLEIPSLEIAGAPITASFVASFKERPDEAVENSKKTLVAQRAKQYLEQHKVQGVLHKMFTQLLERLPRDPLTFMIDFLEQQQDEAEDREVTTREFDLEPGLGDLPLMGLADTMADSGEVPDLTKHHSVAVDVLRRDAGLFERLRDRKTSLGVTLLECVKPGVDCPGHELVKVAGINAGDRECYELYSEIFDPVISQLHGGWTPDRCHPADLDLDRIEDVQIDATGRYAVFASMEARRNLAGLRFATCCSKEERRTVERIATSVIEAGAGELKGTYYPLRTSRSFESKPEGMTLHQEERLRSVGLLFSEPDSRMRLSAGFGRHWPDARGVFVGEMQGLYVWCNEEDHLRFFARQHTCIDLKKLWGRLHRIVGNMEEGAKGQGYSYSRSDRLGYATTDPSRLGSAMRVSVSLRIPLLAETTDLSGLCRTLDLQSTQEIGSPNGGVWSISSTECLGISEVDLLNRVSKGCATLVALEQRLERGEPIFDAMPGLGAAPYPGFPTDACPSVLPDLSGHHSVMASILKSSPHIYEQLCGRVTSSGVSLAACIKPGVDDRGHPKVVSTGMVAGDEGCYKEFWDLFYPVINRMNGSIIPASEHYFDTDLSKLSVTNLNNEGVGVVSVRVELRRNLGGVRLAPCIAQGERREVERLLVQGMRALAPHDAGGYLPLPGSQSFAALPGGMSAAEHARLLAEETVFQEPQGVSRLAAGLGRDWPDARGVYILSHVPRQKDVFIWCNEEDHLRFVAMHSGGNLQGAYRELSQIALELEAQMKSQGDHRFMSDPRLGYLTVDPSNVGNGVCCSVTMRLPNLSSHPDFFPACSRLGLRSAWRGDAWELSGVPSLSVSEVELVNGVVESCAQLAALEQRLAAGSSIDEDLRNLRGCQAVGS